MKIKIEDKPRVGDHVMLAGLTDTAGYVVEISDSGAIQVQCGEDHYWTFPNHIDKLKH